MDTYIFHPPYGGSYEVKIVKSQYTNGRTHLKMVDMEDGLCLLTITANIPEEPLEDGEVIIKNYAQNKGVLDFMLHNQLIGPIKRITTVPHPLCEIADLLI